MRAWWALAVATCALGCGASLKLESSAFSDGGRIPARYTADGSDVSPPLRWSQPPPQTAELALICHDPDAPQRGGWVHWVVYALPADVPSSPEAVEASARPPELGGAVQGKNDFDRLGYSGPSPPPGHGLHHYRFTLYALSRAVRLEPGATRSALLRAMRGHILAEATLVGIYDRP